MKKRLSQYWAPLMPNLTWFDTQNVEEVINKTPKQRHHKVRGFYGSSVYLFHVKTKRNKIYFNRMLHLMHYRIECFLGTCSILLTLPRDISVCQYLVCLSIRLMKLICAVSSETYCFGCSQTKIEINQKRIFEIYGRLPR